MTDPNEKSQLKEDTDALWALPEGDDEEESREEDRHNDNEEGGDSE